MQVHRLTQECEQIAKTVQASMQASVDRQLADATTRQDALRASRDLHQHEATAAAQRVTELKDELTKLQQSQHDWTQEKKRLAADLAAARAEVSLFEPSLK